jgi:hypothetical protein
MLPINISRGNGPARNPRPSKDSIANSIIVLSLLINVTVARMPQIAAPLFGSTQTVRRKVVSLGFVFAMKNGFILADEAVK